MPARKSKPPVDAFPLKLTPKECATLLEAVRLNRGIKDKLKPEAGGSRAVCFTKPELEELADKVELTLNHAQASDSSRLSQVLARIDELLGDLEVRAVRQVRKSAQKSNLVYQFKVTLEGIRPPIWRRFQIPDGTLGELHDVLQQVMGWTDSHLHQFIVGNRYLGATPPDGTPFADDLENEESVLISHLARKNPKIRFTYEYDFGDGWRHTLVLEKTLEPDPKASYPRCLTGKRACPPEDCGGAWGYPDFLEALANPDHPAHEDMKEWIGGEFDPEEFSIDDVNVQLQSR